ncbi:CoA-acylating methylmalonate-semialdehyde dehydrogenase [Temperatibacter marinus]|uniref:methylmalonate-semialdehyde dehydrogenase (CoA acylating) n=1 Tax=Temperatibacter marinus TaxID=1456591 RepID=A0AA52EAY8_9PROT|nr:CoA-acylating methylmalonate-semialdehyde dehydrogenase [Temperatibacter marinus]WND01501.1 CoA-acylating methylmalonate-semialdehyde dehydrogenase [Temperatibacter marinus]
MYEVHHYVNGTVVQGKSNRFGPIFNPSIGEQIGKVALASKEEVENVIAAAEAAQPAWAAQSVVRRARILQNLVTILYREKDNLAKALSREHGKVFSDAQGDVQRGLEVAEFAAGMPHLLKGEFSQNVGGNIDMYNVRSPLGVVAGITPFNFPAMIPLWMSCIAIATGNAFVMKPSEKDPSVPMLLADCWKEAGLPDGIFNVVHGDKEAVDTVCTDPRVKAVSFVGSTSIAKYVYETANAHGKRCQAMGGAKNHMAILPDADLEKVADALIGSAYGSAGERCMAISVAVCVGDDVADKLVGMLKPRVESLHVGHSMDPKAEMAALVTSEHRAKVKGYLDLAEEEGATLVVDGRGFKMTEEGFENGYYLGATLIDNVTAEMKSYKDEIFGPTLQIVRVNTLEEAIALPSQHEYGNGTSIFTASGNAAREYANRVEVGMVGVNVPIPVPLAFHSFGGWKNSAFGDINQHGMEGIRFYTKTKTISQRWLNDITAGAEFAIPTLNN